MYSQSLLLVEGDSLNECVSELLEEGRHLIEDHFGYNNESRKHFPLTLDIMDFWVEWRLLHKKAFLHELLVLEHVLLLNHIEGRSLFGKLFLWF